MRIITSLMVIVAMFVGLIGCHASPADTNRQVKSGIDTVDRNTEAHLDIAGANPDLDQAKITAAQDKFLKKRELTVADIASIETRLKNEEDKMKKLIDTLLAIGGAAVKGGSIGDIGAIFHLVTGKITKSAEANVDKIAENTVAAAANKSELDKMNTDIKLVEKKLTGDEGLEDRIKAVETGTDSLVSMIQLAEDNAKVLSIDNRNKLLAEFQVEMKGNVAKMDKFRTAIAELELEAGATTSELNTIKNMPDEDFLAKYGAGGTAGGIGLIALIRTLLKSRSKEEVDALLVRMRELELDASKKEIPPVTVVAGQGGVPGQGGV